MDSARPADAHPPRATTRGASYVPTTANVNVGTGRLRECRSEGVLAVLDLRLTVGRQNNGDDVEPIGPVVRSPLQHEKSGRPFDPPLLKRTHGRLIILGIG